MPLTKPLIMFFNLSSYKISDYILKGGWACTAASKASGYGPDDRCSNPGSNAIVLFATTMCQTGSATHPASYTLCTRNILLG